MLDNEVFNLRELTLRELHEINCELYDRFIDEVVNKLLEYVFTMDSNKEFLQARIHRVTSEAFLCGFWTERDYYLSLFGASYSNAAIQDFIRNVENNVPEIHAFFEADHGASNFVGKWVLTRLEHSSCARFLPKFTIVKIIGCGDRGYDIQTESGIRMLECGWEV